MLLAWRKCVQCVYIIVNKLFKYLFSSQQFQKQSYGENNKIVKIFQILQKSVRTETRNTFLFVCLLVCFFFICSLYSLVLYLTICVSYFGKSWNQSIKIIISSIFTPKPQSPYCAIVLSKSVSSSLCGPAIVGNSFQFLNSAIILCDVLPQFNMFKPQTLYF